jgi:hypothetical protein
VAGEKTSVIRVALATILVLGCSLPAAARAGDLTGVVTELKPGQGRVEVRAAGTSEWRKAAPLQSLHAGDAVRATGNASVVIVLNGGRGSTRVDAGRSPFVVPPAPASTSGVRRAGDVVQTSLGFLTSTRQMPAQVMLSTRGVRRSPVVVTPRNGPVLPETIRFEWVGVPRGQYSVTVSGPAGIVMERRLVEGTHLDYPADAPALVPAVRYTLAVAAGGRAPQTAWFEILDATRAREVRDGLDELERALDPAMSGTTRSALRAGLLAERGLIHDARRVLVTALERDPDEPTLHLLLGDLYRRADLPEHAAAAFDEAQLLLKRVIQ